MKVHEVMTRDPARCRADDSLGRAAQIMWEHDCGSVPVVDAEHRPIGMITDRDVCMASYTRGQLLSRLPVSAAASQGAATVRDEDTLGVAEARMRTHQVRRLPVVDSEDRLIGMITMGDLIRHAHPKQHGGSGVDSDSIVRTLAAISAPLATALAAE